MPEPTNTGHIQWVREAFSPLVVHRLQAGALDCGAANLPAPTLLTGEELHASQAEAKLPELEEEVAATNARLAADRGTTHDAERAARIERAQLWRDVQVEERQRASEGVPSTATSATSRMAGTGGALIAATKAAR